MFNVTFYSFSKKLNSTARPTGAGTTYACKAKGPFDKLSPVLELQISIAAIPTFNYAIFDGRFYRVTGWTNDGPLWSCALQIDALATWRDSLGAQSIYIYRSSNSWDGQLVDRLYPATTDIRQFKISYQYPIAATFNSTYGAYYVIGLIGKGGVVHRVFNQGQFDSLFNYLLSDAYYIDVLGIFGAVEYPEAKVAINPLQYISSVRAYPYNLIAGAQAISDYTVGTVTMTGKTCYAMVDSNSGMPVDVWTWTTDIDLSNLPGHPQQSRGVWVNAAHGAYSIGVPGFGIIQLDPVLMADSLSLRLSIRLDLVTGNGVLQIFYMGTAGTAPATADSSPLTIHAKIGVDVPMSNVVTPVATAGSLIRQALPGALMAAAGAVAGNPLAAVAGGVGVLNSTIGNATEHQIPRLQQLSQAGSLSNWGYNPEIHAEYTMLAPDDLQGRGRPLCQVRQIDTIPGYIMGDPDEISLACTPSELSTIRAAVAGGFFYE